MEHGWCRDLPLGPRSCQGNISALRRPSRPDLALPRALRSPPDGTTLSPSPLTPHMSPSSHHPPHARTPQPLSVSGGGYRPRSSAGSAVTALPLHCPIIPGEQTPCRPLLISRTSTATSPGYTYVHLPASCISMCTYARGYVAHTFRRGYVWRCSIHHLYLLRNAFRYITNRVHINICSLRVYPPCSHSTSHSGQWLSVSIAYLLFFLSVLVVQLFFYI